MVSRTSLSAVLSSADGWVSSQEAFERCGIGANAATEDIEALYGELRELDINGQIESETVADDQGRKLYDQLRWKRS